MKKLFVASLFLASFNANAFLDFNSYGSGYDDNNWPVWTPMFWMEKVTDNNMFDKTDITIPFRKANFGARWCDGYHDPKAQTQ